MGYGCREWATDFRLGLKVQVEGGGRLRLQHRSHKSHKRQPQEVKAQEASGLPILGSHLRRLQCRRLQRRSGYTKVSH